MADVVMQSIEFTLTQNFYKHSSSGS